MDSNHPLIPINIVIADRTYRIKVADKDEEHVRKTIRIINEKILDFKTQFAGKDIQDYIAMVLVWFATQSQSDTPTNSEFLLSGLSAKVRNMDNHVRKALEGEE